MISSTHPVTPNNSFDNTLIYYLDRLDVVEWQYVIGCIHILSMASGRTQGLLKGVSQLRPVHRSQFFRKRALLLRVQLFKMPEQMLLSRGQERGPQPSHLRSKGQRNFLGAYSRELHISGIPPARMLLKCTASDAMNLTCKRNTIRLPWAPWSGPGSAGRIASDHSGDHLIPALLYDHDQDAAGNTTDNYKRMLASSSRALATTAQACHGLVAGSPRSGHDPAISARWAPGRLAPSGFSHSHGMWV